MIEKLKEAEIRYESILHSLSEPGAMANVNGYAKLMREQKLLYPLVKKYREYKNIEKEIDELCELIEAENGSEFKKELENELYLAKARLNECENELKVLLIPNDPDDNKSVIIEIRAGAGGEEAALFAADLYRMYTMYADIRGLKTERLSSNPTELGGFKEISFIASGEGAFSRFKFESGVHRVQRVPATESQGRIQTSTVTVAVLPEAQDLDIVINPSDLIIESCKSSGAGGQHINKTESAIRIKHIPSGIVVECQEERSQFKNRDKAMALLRSKLYSIAKTEQEEKIAGTRRSQVGTGDRSEKIRTYNFPQKRMTDHRIGLTLYSLEDIMNGCIDNVIDALIAADTAQKLKDGEFNLGK